jgi:Ser/Thr protein kinase RdoA (MazF antagonist)
MDFFPVYDSRLSASHLGQFLQTRYSFHGSVECRILKTGINHSYLADDGIIRQIFRIYSCGWRTKREIEEEIRLLRLLRQNDVPVSYPISDKNGNFIQEIQAPEGRRFGVLFSFAEGEKIRHFTPEASGNIGMAMARFHQITRNLSVERVHYDAETLLLIPLQRAKSFFAPHSETMLFLEATTQALVQKFTELSDADMPSGTVHLDIWFDNMHITPDGAITLFDFDFCGNGRQALDLAYFLVQLFNTSSDVEEYQCKRDCFLEGYESILTVSEDEKSGIPYLAVSLWFFYLGVQCQRFDDWGNLFISEDYFKRFIGIIQKWCHHHQLFT